MGGLSKKRLRREKARLKHTQKQSDEQTSSHQEQENAIHKSNSSWIQEIYENNYKLLLLIPLILFLLAIIQIGYQFSTTGDFMNKGVALKGGITLTIPLTTANPLDIEESLISQFPGTDISVRSLVTPGEGNGMLIEAGITDTDEVILFTNAVEKVLGVTEDTFTIEVIGASLSASFFVQTMRALFIAFLAMGIVVFLYFGENTTAKFATIGLVIAAIAVILIGKSAATDILAGIIGLIIILIFVRYSIPSAAVIAAAFADIIITLAIVNIAGIKMSPASIAAFLMLIGYSVDTDILLSTRVLKRKSGSVMDAVYSAIKTGFTMTGTTIAAVIVGLFLSTSPVLKEIMTIVLIGLLVDLISTWIQNVGLLRWYLDSSSKRGDKE